MMIYLYPNGDTFTIYTDLSYLPEEYHAEVIEAESLPEGDGVLRQAVDGSFYFEPFPEPTPIESIEPEQSVETVGTIDDKLTRLEQQFQEQQMQNLILVDINLTVYEELLIVKEQLQTLTGATDNA